MKSQETREIPFGMRDRLGYMFGDFGNDFTFLLSSMFLMKFYTDVMGVSAALVGAMMMIARIVDAFTDVTMGQICDRSRPGKKGKFTPWLRRMCGPVALASFLMYAVWFKDMPWALRYSGCSLHICSGAASAIRESIFHTVPWHLPLLRIRKKELPFPVSAPSGQRWPIR